jgi:hypothetical protein
VSEDLKTPLRPVQLSGAVAPSLNGEGFGKAHSKYAIMPAAGPEMKLKEKGSNG